MNLKIYTTKDVLIGTHKLPFYQHNDNEAKRSWSLAIKEQPTEIKNDSQLWRIGEFNDQTGIIIPCEPELIAKGSDY